VVQSVQAESSQPRALRRPAFLTARLLQNPYLLIAPSLLLAAFIILFPLGELALYATHDVSRFGKLQEFSGLANMREVIGDELFQASLLRTLIWTAGVVGGTIAASIPVALILNQDFYGRDLARTIIMLPWAVSLTMSAVVWRWALDGDFGMVNHVLRSLGLADDNIYWLATADLAFPVQIVIGILVSIPFTVTVLLGGLSSIPGDLYEAAQIEGANGWQMFTRITLPLIRPFINLAVVLNIIYVFNSFPIIWVLTQGGPSNGTDILVTYLYKLAFRFGRLGDAAAMSLIMFGLLLAFTLLYTHMRMRDDRQA
jgi:multiple sugar transport system permease protein